MKNKIMTCLLLCFFIVQSGLSIAAKDLPNKEEVVYGRMNFDGSMDSLFVVNAFDVFEKTTLEDYGSYLNVVNTTTAQTIDFDGLKATIKDVDKGRFFYQGQLPASAQLPWLITFQYQLDGKPISAADLAGASGQLALQIDVKQNKNVNPIYFNNYLLTITLNLNSNMMTNLVAKDATIANAGDEKTIVFTGLPKKEATYQLSAKVTDFKMKGVQIAALPFNMALDLPDISQFTKGISDLQYGISQINFGATQLASGINQLNQNGSKLNSGANELSDGANQLKEGMNKSASGSAQFVAGLGQYTDGVNQASLGAKELVNGSSQIKDGINLLSTSLNQNASLLNVTPEQQALINASITALQSLKTFLQDDFMAAKFLPLAQALKRETVLALYPNLDTTNPQIESLLAYMDTQALLIEESYNLLAPYQQTIKDQVLPKLDSMIQMLQGITQFKQLIDGVNQLNNQYGLFHDGLVQLSEGLSKLEGSSGQLVSGGQELETGLAQLNQGVSQFADGVNQYSSGITQYTNGVNQLSDGANQLSSGTNQLHAATSNIDSLMQEKIKELMKDYEFEDFTMESFVDKKNSSIKLVQFVLMTQPIEKEEVKQQVIEKEPEKNLLDLFFDLFK